MAFLPRAPFLYLSFMTLLRCGVWVEPHVLMLQEANLERGSVTVIAKPVCIGKRENKHATQTQHLMTGKFSHERWIHPAFGI